MGFCDCDCVGLRNWQEHEYLMKTHFASDAFIFLAYFSIIVAVVYFAKRSKFFQLRSIFLKLCVLLVCGSTHFINFWMITMNSRAIFIAMAIAKIFSAIVSCIAALMLLNIIPDLLNLKTREMFFKRKAEDFDRQIFQFLAQEETAKNTQILINKIRKTVDKHTILRTVALEECSLWMPSRNKNTYHLELSCAASNNRVRAGPSLPMNFPAVVDVLHSYRALQIAETCPLVSKTGRFGERFAGRREALAVRVAVVRSLVSDFQMNELSGDEFGILVVILPSPRKWREHEIELFEIVADQLLKNTNI